MSGLLIACAQISAWVGDFAANRAAALEAVRDAAGQGAQVVLLPEMAITGYPIEDLALRASFQRAAESSATALAQQLASEGLGDVVVIIGSLGVGQTTGRPLNQALVLRGGEITQRYAKHHLPNYGVFDEYRVFAGGADPVVVEVAGHRLGLAICEDLWQDGGPVACYEGAGLTALLVLNGSPFEDGKQQVRLQIAQRRAAQVNAPVVYTNLVGGQDDLVFDGGSFVVSPAGEVLARAGQFDPEVLLWDSSGERRGRLAPELESDEQVYRAIVTGLRSYVQQNGFKSVVLGLSGGIDSALVAVIAADAIGGQNVVGISMPSQWSSEHSKDDAADLAERIGADYRVVPIAGITGAFVQVTEVSGVAAENLQARARGMVLMTVSNMEGHLVLAPGNKSELAAGYSTIYGDAVGGYGPIKDVLKSRVWALARWRNNHAIDRGEIPPIPESSITKPPSAELRPGQLDSDSLPAYDQLDPVIAAYVEHGEGWAELAARGFDAEVIARVLGLVDRAEWKRRQYPPGPKVTALSFSRDRRLPISNRWREQPDSGPTE